MTANLLYKLSHLQKCLNFCKLSVYHRGLSTSVQRFDEKIVIPNRIPRSPTAILEALASTVNQDKSGPHYKYMDDPFLTPIANSDKRSFSLSKESGRKSARWIINTHSKLFQHHPEDPVIKAYLPTEKYTEKSDVSETTIGDLIQKVYVRDAIQVYKICQSKGIELSEKIRQDLLELVCYYNGENALEEDWSEERWYHQGVLNRSKSQKTWKDGGVAEELFNSFENKGSRAYCALIRGMANFYQVDKAWNLYEEASKNEIALDTDTYNSVIRIAPYTNENYVLRWKLVRKLLTIMASKGIKPNLGTLNSVLESLVQFRKWRPVRDISLQILAEFKSIGIEPSLASFYHLLLIHCAERGPVVSILVNILAYIKGRKLEIIDLKDSFFFLTAMDISCNHLKSLDVAQQVHELLCSGDNYSLLGDSFKESIYYRHFFTIVCAMESADNVMKFYNEHVPHVYTPEPRVSLLILENMEVHNALHFVPQIWTDLKLFNHNDNARILPQLLQCLTKHKPSADNEHLTNQMSEIALDIWSTHKEQKKIDQEKGFQQSKYWAKEIMSGLIITLVNCGKYENAVEIFREYFRSPGVVVGSASLESLTLLYQVAVDKKDSAQAIDVALYAADDGLPEAFNWARNISSSLNLTSVESAKLASLLGDGNGLES